MLTPTAAAIMIVLLILLVATAVYGPQWFGRERDAADHYTERPYREHEYPQTPPWANTGADPQHADWPETDAVAEGRATLRGDLGWRETPRAERARLRCGKRAAATVACRCVDGDCSCSGRTEEEPSFVHRAATAMYAAGQRFERGLRKLSEGVVDYIFDSGGATSDGAASPPLQEHYGGPPGREPAPEWWPTVGDGTRTRAPREGSTASGMLDLIERSA